MSNKRLGEDPSSQEPNAQRGRTDDGLQDLQRQQQPQQQQQQPQQNVADQAALASAPAATASTSSALQPGNTTARLDAVVSLAADGIVQAVINKFVGPVVAGCPSAVLGGLIGEAVRPFITELLTTLAASVTRTFSTDEAPENVEQNASNSAGGANASYQDLFLDQKMSVMSVLSRRNLISRPSPVHSAKEFSVASYDLDHGMGEPPNNRSYRSIRHIIELNSDVIAIQSITSPEFVTLQLELARLGYEGLRCERANTGLNECIFFRVDRFILFSEVATSLTDLIRTQMSLARVEVTQSLANSIRSISGAVMIELLCRQSGQHLMVATTKLIPSTLGRDDLQSVQLCSILKLMSSGEDAMPCIVTGNFELTPKDRQYQVLNDGYPDETTKDLLSQQTELIDMYEEGFTHPLDKIESAYKGVTGEEPKTCYDETLRTMRESSYILHDASKTTAVSVLAMPEAEWMGTTLPNDKMASCHVALKAYFTFKVPE